MIKLLREHSLEVLDRFQAERISLQLAERTSTASLTLSDRAPVLSVGNWLQMEDGPAGGIVWRVKSIDTQYDTNTRTVQLEHIISALKDRLMFGETKTKDISGGENAGCRQTVNYILAYQDDWILGDIEYNDSNPYSFNGDDLFASIETVSSSLDSCIWEYDFSSYPFRLYIRRMDDTVHSEMRMDRNIKTLRKTIDRSRMYTRHYPIGKDDLHISGDYVSANENIYGVICKVETDQSKDTEGKLRAWAQERLKKHCEPFVTVTISGLDLEEATGEPLDTFTIGKICRVPLPEFSTQINERVTKLSYTDIINDPMTVTVTLANELQDVASIIRQQESASARGGRAGAKKAGEDHAWFVDTEEHVGLVAEAVAGPGADKDWSRVASIFVDGQGIHQRVVYTENELVTHETQIDANEERILLEAVNRENADNALSGRITVQADRITAEVANRQNGDSILQGRINVQADRITQEVRERQGADTDLSGRITVTAREIRQEVTDTENRLSARIKVNSDEIELKVNKNGVVSAINQTAEEVKIQASKINLSGYVTASQLAATQADIDNLMTGKTTASKIVCDDLRLPSGFWYHGNKYTEFYSSTEQKYLLGRS